MLQLTVTRLAFAATMTKLPKYHGMGLSVRPNVEGQLPPRSELRDSNPRPSAPKADALPDCAKLRFVQPQTFYAEPCNTITATFAVVTWNLF